MKKIALSIAFVLVCAFSYAQQEVKLVSPSVDPEGDARVFEQMQEKMAKVRSNAHRPTVAVVLSGGGAKGAAHVGVLKRIQEKGIPVDMILGTSMGGLVGGLYALGYSPDFLDTLLSTADWPLLLSDDINQKYVPYSTKAQRSRYNLLIPFDAYTQNFVKGRARKNFVGRGTSFASEGAPVGGNAFSVEGAHSSYADGRTHSTSFASEVAPTTFKGSLPSGWVSGLNVENMLARLCATQRDSISFTELPIPFVCVAADLVSGKSKNWTSGDIAIALRSTMSIPGLFKPVRHNGMVLADGGMRNNFPTDLARAMGADIVIGVVLSQFEASNVKVENIGDIINRSIDMLSREAYDQNISGTNIIIRPHMPEYNMLSFSSEAIADILGRGYNAALQFEDALDRVVALTANDHNQVEGELGSGQSVAVAESTLPSTKAGSALPVAKALPVGESTLPAAVDIATNPIFISQISFNGVPDTDAAFLSELIGIKAGRMITSPLIEEAVSRIFATYCYQKVNYRLLSDNLGGYKLQFNLENRPSHVLALAGRADTEDMVSALLGIGINSYKLMGSKLFIEARLGQNWYAKAHYTLSYPHLPALNLRLQSGKTLANMIVDARYCDAGIWHHKADLFVSGLRASHFDLNAGIKYDYYSLNTWLSEPTLDDNVFVLDAMDTYKRNYFTLYGNLRAYTLDDKYFPSKGFTLGLDYNWVLGQNPKQILALDYLQHFRLNDYLSVIPSLYIRYVVGENISLKDNLFLANFLGGAMQGRYFKQQMPFDSFHRCMILQNYAVDLQLNVRAKLAEKTYLSLKGGIVRHAGSLIGLFNGNASNLFGGAIEFGYEAFAGPIKVSLQTSPVNRLGLYVSFGYDF